MQPLTKLTRKDENFIWGEEQRKAFQELKNKLVQRRILSIFDHRLKTELHTDASSLGYGGILLQYHDKNLHPVAYFSKQTSREEMKYHSYELETLAVVKSLKRFRIYLLGAHFTLKTDCAALRTTLSKKDLLPRIARWWLQIQEFDFDIEYREGTRMAHVDALSRNPLQNKTETILTIRLSDWDWVTIAQSQDDRVKEIIKILENTPKTKNEHKIHGEYKIEGGKLMKIVNGENKIYVPKRHRSQLVRTYHDKMGHFAVSKTLNKIQEEFWFPAMRKYVLRYVSCCLQCQYNKSSGEARSGELHPIEKIGSPMHTLHIDHLGPFVKSTKGNSYLIVVIDGFTKYVFLKAVADTKSVKVCNFLREIFPYFGVPVRLICDRGSAFTSDLFKKFCKTNNIKQILNATATPRANGQCERYNRTVLNSIMTSIDEEDKWDRCLSDVVWAINNTRSESTGKTAYQMMFGIIGRGTNDCTIKPQNSTRPVEDVQKIRESALEKIKNGQETMKERFDKGRVKRRFKIDDLVLVRRKRGSNQGMSRKLMPKYDGPYKIIEVLENDRYVVTDVQGAQRYQKRYTGVHPVDSLKLFKMATDSDESNSQDSDMTEDDEGTE